ncbi:MAG: (2Fe-2S)-binding protein, partial [Kineosporiaceae bacterium]
MSETFGFDGHEIPFRPGQSIGAALWVAGERALRTTRIASAPRGLFCGIGVCFDCLVVIDGVPDQRACVTPAAAGLEVRTQHGAQAPPSPIALRQVVGERLRADVVVIGGGPAG